MASGGTGTRPLNVPEAAAAALTGAAPAVPTAAAASLDAPRTLTSTFNVPMPAELAAVSLHVLEWTTGTGIAQHMQHFSANAGEIAKLTGVLAVCYAEMHRYTKQQLEARFALLRDAASVPGVLAREAEYALLHEPLRAARALVLAGCSTCSDNGMSNGVEADGGLTLALADVAALLCVSVDAVETAFPAVTAAFASATAITATLHDVYSGIGLEATAIARRLQQLAVVGCAAVPPPTSRERAYVAHFACVRALRKLIQQVLDAHASIVADCIESGAMLLDAATTGAHADALAALLVAERQCAAEAAAKHMQTELRNVMARAAEITGDSPVTVLRLDPATTKEEPAPAFGSLINIVVLGSGEAGKSCLVTRMCRCRWVKFSTAGAAGFDLVRLRVGGTKVCCMLSDPVDGSRRSEAKVAERVSNAHGALLVYHATKHETLGAVHRWLALLEEHVSPLPPCILVAAYADKVTAEAELSPGRALAEEYGMPFFAASALTGAGCDDAFFAIVRAVVALRTQHVVVGALAAGAASTAAPASDTGTSGAAVGTASSCVIS